MPYEAYRPGFTDVMDGIGRGTYDGLLVDASCRWPATSAALTRGIRAVDVGCGTGHCVNLMAARLPGVDVRRVRPRRRRDRRGPQGGRRLGLTNATFEVRDVVDLPADPPFDAAFAFDAIHDQAARPPCCAGIHDALRPGGRFVMVDIKASSDLDRQPRQPVRAAAVRDEHAALPDRVAGVGRGRPRRHVGAEIARRMLADAGFTASPCTTRPATRWTRVYVSRRPSP